jgi:hypothetical protein
MAKLIDQLDAIITYDELRAGAVMRREETDPTGKNPHELGAKLDAGKVSAFRGAIDYFPRAIDSVAAVSTFGASKYAWKGWETVPDGVARYSDALVRHLLAEGRGELQDRDSGMLHAAHAAWNALARLELMLREQEPRKAEPGAIIYDN